MMTPKVAGKWMGEGNIPTVRSGSLVDGFLFRTAIVAQLDALFWPGYNWKSRPRMICAWPRPVP